MMQFASSLLDIMRSKWDLNFLFLLQSLVIDNLWRKVIETSQLLLNE